MRTSYFPFLEKERDFIFYDWQTCCLFFIENCFKQQLPNSAKTLTQELLHEEGAVGVEGL